MEYTIMSRYRQSMAEALHEVRDNGIEEGRMKDIFTADQEGKSAEEIAKIMKLPLKTVKQILGEGINPYISMQRDKNGKMNYVVLDKDEKETFRSLNYILAKDYLKKNYNKLKEEVIQEFSDAMLDKLKREYEPLKGKTISIDQANKLRKIFNMIPDRALDALRRKKIPFLSGLALSRMIQKGMPVKEETELEESAAAAEIQRTNTRRDSMDYGMYKKAVELLRTKQYAKLGKHIYDAETAPREYVMGVIAKKRT